MAATPIAVITCQRQPAEEEEEVAVVLEVLLDPLRVQVRTRSGSERGAYEFTSLFLNNLLTYAVLVLVSILRSPNSACATPIALPVSLGTVSTTSVIVTSQ